MLSEDWNEEKTDSSMVAIPGETISRESSDLPETGMRRHQSGTSICLPYVSHIALCMSTLSVLSVLFEVENMIVPIGKISVRRLSSHTQ
jgi:hypothetical protein